MKRGNIDTDQKIALFMDDRTLLNLCNTDRYFFNDVCNDDFFHRKLQQDYPDTIDYREPNKRWKEYAYEIIMYVNLLKEKYNYKYIMGNPKTQYKILKNRESEDRFVELWDDEETIEEARANRLLVESAMTGELALVIEALSRGADINASEKDPIRRATEFGYMDIVKYLIEKGAKVNQDVMRDARKHPEIYKYLAKRYPKVARKLENQNE